jgi:hypothetical protein
MRAAIALRDIAPRVLRWATWRKVAKDEARAAEAQTR